MGNPARSHSASVLKWVRPPQQARTRQSLGRILDAAEELVSIKDFDEVPISELAKRAGSSVGSFYRRFADKQGLLHALHERFCEEARATTDDALDPARWTEAPLAEVIDAFTGFLVDIYREREGLFRAFLVRGVSDATMRERNEDLLDYLTERLAALLAFRRREMSHPDPVLASAFGLRMMMGTLIHGVLLRPARVSVGDERFVDELARALKSYLIVEPGRR